MKKFYYLTIVFAIIFSTKINAKTYTVTNSSFTFSPASLTIMVGDTVKFQISNSHNVVEVAKSSYDKNDSTSNGGFRLPYGGGELHFDAVGIHYYVCAPHAHLGMKGIIEVKDISTGIEKAGTKQENQFAIYPNPAVGFVNIRTSLKATSNIELQLFDITGKIVQQRHDKNVSPGNYLSVFEFDKNIKTGRYILQFTCNE
jgi:plastocyanin